MNDIKVSIIIPVYNSKDFLIKCIDSALNQTLKDIEVICIDDGSSDGSLDKLNHYANVDSRLKVFSQTNQGAGAARNKGLNCAKGEYIVFLDSDDFIELTMCEELYNHAKSLDSDLVLFNNRWYFEDGITEDFIHFETFEEDFKSFVFDYHFMRNKVLSGFFSVIWTKFYKSSFLKDNKINFPSHKLYNDMEFHIKSVLLANKIAYFPKICYHYNKSGHSSLQTNYVGKKEAIVFYDVMCGIRDFLYENDFIKEFRIDFLNFTFRHFYSKLNEMDENYKNEYFLKIKRFLESLLISIDEFNQMSFRNLVIYVHIVSSDSYEEYELRMELFDTELLNPNTYSDLNDTIRFKKELGIENNYLDDDSDDLKYDIGNLDNEFLIEKYKNDSNKLYNILLEEKLTYSAKKIEMLNYFIGNLKNTTDEYYRIKENYKIIQEQNKKLIKENNDLKKGVSYKIKKLF